MLEESMKPMSMTAFLKQNKTVKENVKYAATKSLCDDKGKPLMWEICHITTKVNEGIQNKAMYSAPIQGKPGQFTQKIDVNKYVKKLVAASIVYPDLLDKSLQDSYGVLTPEDLVQEMIDDSGEWNALVEFINNLNNFTGIEEDIEIAKN